jgi:hypothetical protein
MICCQICYEPYDQSIRRPYSMSSCPHTYCLKCLEQITNNRCPECGIRSKGKNLNMALLQLIPESEYDKLKAESLKALIHLNEAKKYLKQNRLEKLNIHETKLESIKQVISDETDKIINILKEKKNNLINECNQMLYRIKNHLTSTKYEDKESLQIGLTKVKIENNELNEDEMKSLNNKITEINNELNKLSESIRNYENNSEFVLNKISQDSLLICDLKTV